MATMPIAPKTNPELADTPRLLVVAGLCIHEGKVLLTKRKAKGDHPGLWEFPGGKVEKGESPAAALVREIREEVALDIDVGRVYEVAHHGYPSFEVVVIFYLCERVDASQTATALDVADFAWVSADDISGYAFLAADKPLVEKLAKRGLPLKVD